MRSIFIQDRFSGFTHAKNFKRNLIVAVLVAAFFMASCQTRPDKIIRGEDSMHEYKLNDNATLYWLGHASFKIKVNSKTMYIDPYELEDTEEADIVLITHAHYDHCSISDLQKIVGENTVILAPGDCTSKFAGKVKGNLVLVGPNEKKVIEGISIETVPAYNTNKQFHPKENGWVGYIINASGTRIYHAGDTDIIPEMDSISTDVALLPVGGTYTMDAEEAARACDAIKPKVAIPMHYNKIVGMLQSAEKFKELAACDVVII